MSIIAGWPTFLGELQLEIHAVNLDSEPFTDYEPSTDRLELFGTDWEALEIQLECFTDEAPVTEMKELVGYVLLSSRATNLRAPFTLTADESASGCRFAGRVVVDRAQLADIAEMTASVQATFDGRPKLVGTTRTVTLAVERIEPPTKQGVPPIRQVWVDFAGSEAPLVCRSKVDGYAAIDVSTDKPVLYLNSGLDGLQVILTAEKPQLERRRLRDVIGADIARYTTAALFRAGAAEVVATAAEGESADFEPVDELLRRVCEAIAGAIPRLTSVDELYSEIAAKYSKRSDFAELWTEVDAAIDTLTGASKAVETATSEVKHG